MAYMPSLHHLRCVAALIVLIHHYLNYYLLHWKPQPQLFAFGLFIEGHTGVGLFFALSGFLFTTIALQGSGEVRYWPFLRNRLLRILPLYTFIFFIALSIERDLLRGSNLLDGYLFANLVGPDSLSLITGAAWTIPVEFAFYLIFPFLMKFFLAGGPTYLIRLIALLIAVKIGIFVAADNADSILYTTLPGRLDGFLFGMLAAGWSHRYPDLLHRHARRLFAASSLATIVALALLARYASLYGPPKQWMWVLWPTIEGVLWSAVIASYAAAKLRLPKRLDAALQRGGEISYSLYMLHSLAIYTLFQILGPVSLTGRPLIDLALNAVPVALAAWWLASISYEVIERPFLAMRGNYLRT